MKLSTERKLGHIHVRGGQLVRVVHEHTVDTKGWCQRIQKTELASEPMPPEVTARAGDLAIEIVNVKTGAALGYSYLSGAATQVNCYQIHPERYEPAILAWAPVAPPAEGLELTDDQWSAYWAYFVDRFIEMKVAQGVDVFVMRAALPTKDVLETIWATVVHALKLRPKGEEHITEEEGIAHAIATRRSHILCALTVGKSKNLAFLHYQPPRDAIKVSATPFQASLCHEALVAADAPHEPAWAPAA